MTKPRPVLLIAGCQKYRDYLTAAIQRLSKGPWTTIGIVGGGAQTVFDPSSHILTIAIADTYEALPSKLHAAYKWIYENFPGIPGIFKTDEDILFDMPALAAAIETNQDLAYWGVTYSMCREAPVNAQRIALRFDDKTRIATHQTAIYCFGAGYYMSAAALPVICEAAADYADSVLEDVCTGFVLNRARIFPKKVPVAFREVPRGPQLLALQ